ncbi:MAG: GTP-binding protein [Bacteroidetes bacterium]|nr:GTP-binding protein [Bacteroidota bacterium]
MSSTNNIDLLRFATAGSVDDGKSTLIGRLLHDSKSILQDQLENIKALSEKRGDNFLNLALLTDGLRAEREQGITIDVAYRYFSTPKRKFILADSPGHAQYTRNMITAVSGVSLVIVMIDARNGVVEQTRRHSFIAELLGVKHLIVSVNKMDLVDYNQTVFTTIKDKYTDFISKTSIPDVQFVPISALKGDNVVDKSTQMHWYDGPTLMYLLENVQVNSDYNRVDCRFPVQTVIRPQSADYHDYRGYAGRVASGVFKKNDEVIVLPSKNKTRIKKIDTFDGELNEAFAPMSVTLLLEDNIDISRGDMIVKPNNLPMETQELDVMVCWLSDKKLVVGGKYILKHTTKEVKCVVKEVYYKINIQTLHRYDVDTEIGLNDIGKIKLKIAAPLLYDSYQQNKATGSLILIDESTLNTVAACTIR